MDVPTLLNAWWLSLLAILPRHLVPRIFDFIFMDPVSSITRLTLSIFQYAEVDKHAIRYVTKLLEGKAHTSEAPARLSTKASKLDVKNKKAQPQPAVPSLHSSSGTTLTEGHVNWLDVLFEHGRNSEDSLAWFHHLHALAGTPRCNAARNGMEWLGVGLGSEPIKSSDPRLSPQGLHDVAEEDMFFSFIRHGDRGKYPVDVLVDPASEYPTSPPATASPSALLSPKSYLQREDCTISFACQVLDISETTFELIATRAYSFSGPAKGIRREWVVTDIRDSLEAERRTLRSFHNIQDIHLSCADCVYALCECILKEVQDTVDIVQRLQTMWPSALTEEEKEGTQGGSEEAKPAIPSTTCTPVTGVAELDHRWVQPLLQAASSTYDCLEELLVAVKGEGRDSSSGQSYARWTEEAAKGKPPPSPGDIFPISSLMPFLHAASSAAADVASSVSTFELGNSSITLAMKEKEAALANIESWVSSSQHFTASQPAIVSPRRAASGKGWQSSTPSPFDDATGSEPRRTMSGQPYRGSSWMSRFRSGVRKMWVSRQDGGEEGEEVKSDEGLQHGSDPEMEALTPRAVGELSPQAQRLVTEGFSDNESSEQGSDSDEEDFDPPIVGSPVHKSLHLHPDTDHEEEYDTIDHNADLGDEVLLLEVDNEQKEATAITPKSKCDCMESLRHAVRNGSLKKHIHAMEEEAFEVLQHAESRLAKYGHSPQGNKGFNSSQRAESKRAMSEDGVATMEARDAVMVHASFARYTTYIALPSPLCLMKRLITLARTLMVVAHHAQLLASQVGDCCCDQPRQGSVHSHHIVSLQCDRRGGSWVERPGVWSHSVAEAYHGLYTCFDR